MSDKTEVKYHLKNLINGTNYISEELIKTTKGDGLSLSKEMKKIISNSNPKITKSKKNKLVEKMIQELKEIIEVYDEDYSFEYRRILNKQPAGTKEESDFFNSLFKNEYTKSEAAELLNRRRQTINWWIRNGKKDIKTVKKGGKEYIPKEEIVRIYKDLNSKKK
ncbi:MAG: helix-turn-helix domain-containing protein [Flavobacteriales bacterium]